MHILLSNPAMNTEHMKNGDIVVDMRNQQKYIVNDKFMNPFVKILEIAN